MSGGTGSYSSPLGLYPFQAEGIGVAYLQRSLMACWDTGTGKSHLSMALAAMLVADAEIGSVLICCEKNKLREWEADFRRFTGLEPVAYHGPSRARRLERAEGPAVIVSTYETVRNDSAVFVKGAGRGMRGVRTEAGPLTRHLRKHRPLVIYDEMPGKLGTRTSQSYKAHAFLLKELRREDPGLRVLAMTANPMTAGEWENLFNVLRLVVPSAMPTVTEFNKRFVSSRDLYGRPTYNSANIGDFIAMCQPYILRKRKTDPDVIEQFPKKVEEVLYVQMTDAQRQLYELVEGLAWDDQGDYVEVPGLYVALRQLAGHPGALIRAADRGGSQLARQLVEGLGADSLRQLGSAKAEALAAYLQKVRAQGDKAMVFTFFGRTVLPELQEFLRDRGMQVYAYHGGMSSEEQSAALSAFRTHEGPAVLLSSDAGAKGINVPEATYVVEYDCATTYMNHDQRLNRHHRIDSTAPSVTCTTMVLEGTLEESIADKMLRRNAQQDQLFGEGDLADEDFVTSADRRQLFGIARSRRRTPHG